MCWTEFAGNERGRSDRRLEIAVVVAGETPLLDGMKTVRRPRILPLAGCALACLLLTACFKVVHESTFQTVDLSGKADQSDAQLKAAIAEVIKNAKGVDAWRDVSFKRLDDGRIHFKGTAYFRHLSELELPNQTMLNFSWAKDADGKGVLTLREKPGGPGGEKKPADWAKLSPAERTKKIKEERAKFQQMKPMMTGFIGTMKHSAVFHLPGKPGESAGFVRDPSGALRIDFDGARMLAAMETLLNDDAWIARNSGNLGAQEMPANDERLSELLFGGKGPLRAAVSGLAGAAFDYEAEVAAAKADFAAVEPQLATGAEPVASAAPARGESLKALKVVGVRLVTEVDEKLELQPLGAGAGYTVALLAELPGSVLAMTDECSLDTAVADDGSDLLPESEFSRRISFPKLSADKATVLIEAELKAPGAGVRGLKELSGHLQYRAAGGTKEIELGFAKLAAKAKGKALDAQIESIAANGDGGKSQSMELQLAVHPDGLRALYVVTGGNRVELKQRGYSGSGEAFTYTYEAEAGFPAKSRLVAEVYDQLQTFDVPFKLENVTLLGEPIDAK